MKKATMVVIVTAAGGVVATVLPFVVRPGGPPPSRFGVPTPAVTHHNPAADVTVTDCVPRGSGMIVAHLDVTNRGELPRTYRIRGEVTSGSRRVSDLSATVRSLRPGQSATTTAIGHTDDPGPLTCRLVDVTTDAR